MKTALLITLLLLPALVIADGHGDKYAGENRGKPLQPAQLNAKWQQECGSCHLA